MVEVYNNIVLNSEAPSPTYISPPPRTSSILDLAIVSPGVSPLYLFKTGEDPMGSDHLPIFIALSQRIDRINTFSHRIKILDKHLGYLHLSEAEAEAEAISVRGWRRYQTRIQ